MKRVTQSLTIFLAALLFVFWGNVEAQDYNFENYDLGHSFAKIGWSQDDLIATVANDPVAAGNKVLKVEVKNYNAAPVLAFVIPAGKTLADYSTFKFKAYFAQGDVGWKDIIVEAYQTLPTGRFNTPEPKIGSWNRAAGGSTAWEDITIDVTNARNYTDTIYIAFGIHCAGTGNIGGSGVPTIWYADDIDFIGGSSSQTGDPYWTEKWNDDIVGQLTGTTAEAPTTLTEVTQSTGIWKAIYAIRGGSNQCDGIGRTLRLLVPTGRPQGGAAVTPKLTEGVDQVTFVEGRGGANRVIEVSKSRDDGATWIVVETINGTVQCAQIVVNVNDPRANRIKFENKGTGDVDIDDIAITKNTDEWVDETLVTHWGATSSGTAWPILNDASTPAGNAGMGDGNVPTGWATIRGEFGTLNATTTEAVVVTGKLQLVGGGGGNGYTHLRYALTFQDSTTLQNPLTTTALWASTKGHYGYGFHPRSGTGTLSNARGGAGTLWLIDGGGFNSGWGGNNTAAVGVNGNTVQILQAPRNAEMVEGTYNFGISVKMINDTTSEVKWYLVEENNKYWFGGSQIVKAKTDKFNGISFGVNNDSHAKQFNLMEVKAQLGDHVVVPEAPWEAYYVDQWGLASEGKAWPILNNAETLVGDATMGNGAPPTGWATMRGGFGQDLPLKEDKFLVTFCI